MYILDVRHFQGNEQLKTDVRVVFGFLQRQNDIQKLRQYVEENEEVFSDMEEDAYDMISIMSNSNELIKCKEEYEIEKGEYKRKWNERMCFHGITKTNSSFCCVS